MNTFAIPLPPELQAALRLVAEQRAAEADPALIARLQETGYIRARGATFELTGAGIRRIAIPDPL